MEILKHNWRSFEALEAIKNGKPVVLLECPIICPAYANWNFETVAQMIKKDFLCDVYVSTSKRFPYWDAAKNTYNYRFDPLTKKESMTFDQYLRVKRSDGCNLNYYLHQSLVQEMGPIILQEYTKFSLNTAELYKMLAGWNDLTQNLLLCGSEGFITPLHYDEQENLFAQLFGQKRVRLYAPEFWHALYPFPNGHPQDRQCQITLPEIPGAFLECEEMRFRYPAFQDAAPFEMWIDLQPGEILYIPPCWFHQMEGLSDNISLTWWFKHLSNKSIDYNNIKISEISLPAVRRNIGKYLVQCYDFCITKDKKTENLMARMVGTGNDAQKLFLSIASGRIKLKGVNYEQGARIEENTLSSSSMPSYFSHEILPVDFAAASSKLQDIDEYRFQAIADQAVTFLQTIFKDNASTFLLHVVRGRFNAF